MLDTPIKPNDSFDKSFMRVDKPFSLSPFKSTTFISCPTFLRDAAT